ncbi:MAG: hypothetical protein PHE43_04645 [Candidatus Nanoarchaeia archaeon]|nr:hypothetical protein [Candidatus Nanoarchaeia archaeon]
MTKTGAVENLGEDAQKQAIELSVSGLTSQTIADKLNEQFNSNITSEEVKNFLKRKNKATSIMLKQDKNFQNKLAQAYFDTVKQLRDLNSEMWKVFYEMRKDPEFLSKTVICPHCDKKLTVQLKTYSSLLKTADVLLNQIKHVDAILGKMQKKSLNITYNYVDLSKKIGLVMPDLLAQMEKRGVVRINKKRLKLYSGGKNKKMEFEEKENEEEDEFSEEDLDEEED